MQEMRFLKRIAPYRTATSERVAGEDAVVFSSYVPTVEALAVASEFLQVFKERFSDCDFYVGINTGSLPEWRRMLEASGLRSLTIGEVEPRLAVDSDVSGFQRALQTMHDGGKDYRLVWMGHTKGATANNPDVRRHLIKDFYMKRDRITRVFNNPRVGSFGHDATVDLELAALDALMDERLFRFPCRGIGTFYLHTFYALRGSIVRKFLDGCSVDFYTRNIVSELGFDRYFFERDFSRLADKSGYYPVYRTLHQHFSTIPVTPKSVRELYRTWEQQLPRSMRTKIRVRTPAANLTSWKRVKSLVNRTPLRTVVRWLRRVRQGA